MERLKRRADFRPYMKRGRGRLASLQIDCEIPTESPLANRVALSVAMPSSTERELTQPRSCARRYIPQLSGEARLDSKPERYGRVLGRTDA